MHNCRYTDYPHPLHFAAAVGKEAGVIKNLVNWYGVNVKDEKYRTPLMFTALGNKVICVLQLQLQLLLVFWTAVIIH